MWFNSSHAHQYAFDQVAWEYEDARPRFDLSLVAEMATAGGLAPGDEVYEIGAGTGQLTSSLLEFGFAVTANEPGVNMRSQLAQLDSRRLRIRELPFEEDGIVAHSYAAVFAANSFHWIKPEVAFAKVHEIVSPGGALCLVWNFAFLEPEVQAQLNRSAFVGHDDLVQDPGLGIDAFEQVMAAGRDLISASGLFENPWSDWHAVERALSASQYADLAVSFASTAALADDARFALQDRIVADLDQIAVADVTVTDHIYLCVARTRPA